MLVTYVTYTSEPINFEVALTIDAGAAISDTTGCVARADALNLDTGLKIAGSSAITGLLSMQNTFSAGALAAGLYEIQTLLTPPSAPAQVVNVTRWLVKEGAAV